MKYVFDGMEVPGAKVPAPNERVLKVLLSPEIGNTEKLTLLFSIISPGKTTGLHTHDVDEIMYVATGRGECIVGEEKGKLREDTVLFAPKLVKHEVKNTVDETLKLICFYVPPMKPTGYFAEAISIAKEYFKHFR